MKGTTRTQLLWQSSVQSLSGFSSGAFSSASSSNRPLLSSWHNTSCSASKMLTSSSTCSAVPVAPWSWNTLCKHEEIHERIQNPRQRLTFIPHTVESCGGFDDNFNPSWWRRPQWTVLAQKSNDVNKNCLLVRCKSKFKTFRAGMYN